MQPIEPNRSEPPGFEPRRPRPDDPDAGFDAPGESQPDAHDADAGSEDAAEPHVDVGDADAIDLDAVERDLDEVERTLDRLAEGTYWSDDGPEPAAAATGLRTDEQPGAPA